MKKLSVADTLEMSIDERLQLVEDIWDTIALKAENISLTEAEKQEVNDRLEKYHKNPDTASPWKEVLNRISKDQ